jgi:molybdopterin/thiamine biosynthesis adenylyltransferase
LISKAEQAVLRGATVAIPGLGGVGGAHLLTLARMGVGNFHIADADRFSLANFNRQYGAVVSTIDKEKSDVMEAMAHDINPEATIKTWKQFVDASNVEAFLNGCDLVVDSLESFALDARRIVYAKAREKGIPVVSAGPIGFSSSMFVVTPESMSFDEYFDIHDGLDPREKFKRFFIGLTPSPYYLKYMDTTKVNQKEKYGPSVASAVALCSGFAATEAVKILLKRKKVRGLPAYHYFDPYLMKFKLGVMPWGNKNPVQKLKLLYLATKLKKGDA